MAPKYYFSITPMQQRNGTRMRSTSGGRWMPPTGPGSNVPSSATLYFHHDGQTTTAIPQIPTSALFYKAWSMYHDRALIWTIDCDAIHNPVGTGDDRSPWEEARGNSGFDGAAFRDDWRNMTFSHRPQDYVSYVGRRLDKERLRVSRPDQIWSQQILPDPYCANTQDVTTERRFGGLIGDLPLLLGLMTFAIPEPQVATALAQIIRNPWVVYPPNMLPRRAGWQDRRGLVV